MLCWAYFVPEPEHPDNSFYDCEVRGKSVLIVEPNAYHGEILPGFAKYFQDLGFSVDIFLRPRNVEENPFCDYPKDKLPRFFLGNAAQLKKMLRSEKIAEYEYVLFSSMHYEEKYKFCCPYLQYLGFVPQARKGLLFVAHAFSVLKDSADREYLRQGRVFILWPFESVAFLNPHYFGKNSAISPKNAQTRFIAIGIALSRHSFSLILAAAKKLLAQGDKNFEIVVIGRGGMPKIPKELGQHMNFKGGLDFAGVFKELRASDFIILPLSYSIKQHRAFLQGQVSGSNQLALGFGKPCLVEETFADSYGFTEENAVLHKQGQLHSAMKRALDMCPGDYLKRQENLRALAEDLYRKSLNNLQEVVRGSL